MRRKYDILSKKNEVKTEPEYESKYERGPPGQSGFAGPPGVTGPQGETGPPANQNLESVLCVENTTSQSIQVTNGIDSTFIVEPNAGFQTQYSTLPSYSRTSIGYTTCLVNNVSETFIFNSQSELFTIVDFLVKEIGYWFIQLNINFQGFSIRPLESYVTIQNLTSVMTQFKFPLNQITSDEAVCFVTFILPVSSLSTTFTVNYNAQSTASDSIQTTTTIISTRIG
jgi:hypothetical protein